MRKKKTPPPVEEPPTTPEAAPRLPGAFRVLRCACGEEVRTEGDARIPVHNFPSKKYRTGLAAQCPRSGKLYTPVK